MKKQYGKNDIALSQLKLSFITEFEHYLLTIHGVQMNTTHKNLINLKKVVKLVLQLEWVQKNGHETILKYGKLQKALCLDDLDVEQNMKHFGNECNTNAEILLYRYNLFQHEGVLTHATTNLNAN